MGTYEDLTARGNLRFTATRPGDTPLSETNIYWPVRGTVVPCVLSQPVQDMLTQGKANGWANAGTLGNTDHLRKHGDHTPWSAGKTRQVIYAKDTNVPTSAMTRMFELCRAADYDTTWIAFFNWNGKQYDFAGRVIDGSADTHLHISVRKGHEMKRVTLFADMTKTGGAVTTPKPSTPAPTTPQPTPGSAVTKDYPYLVKQIGAPEVWLVDGFRRRHVTGPAYPHLVAKHGKEILVDDAADYGDL
jgi:hypothetical protein